MTALPAAVRDPSPLLERTIRQWGGQEDLWVFGYASLIWRPEFDYVEQRAARVHGWHRALKMWSRINRGSPACPGLVFCLLPGGSCRGVAFRIPKAHGHAVLGQLWQREMPIPVYEPRWLRCHSPEGAVNALAFTLPRASPSHTGELADAHYRQIFREATGRYGTTHDYARATLAGLRAVGIRDRQLERLLARTVATEAPPPNAGAAASSPPTPPSPPVPRGPVPK